MKKKINQLLTILFLAVLATSCNKTSPAGFWTTFHKDLIAVNKSDQGPWGGHRELKWKAEMKGTFTELELIEFSKNNDWELIDSIKISIDTMTSKSFSDLKNDDYSLYIIKDKIIPELSLKDNKIFIFKTTWLAVEPGNTRETFENGFAILNSDNTELKIFHFWGE